MTLTLDIIPIGPEEEMENIITTIQTQNINSHTKDVLPELITDAEEATDHTISQTDPRIFHMINTCIQPTNNIIQTPV